MRPLLRPLVALALIGILLMSCTESDVEDYQHPGTITDPGTAGALADYWNAGDQAGTSLSAANDLWESFAVLAADPSAEAGEVLTAAQAYAAACTLAASDMDAWADLERSISSFGGVKREIDETAREAVLGTLEAGSGAAMTSAEAIVVSWLTLGGLASLRDALADPEGTLPVEGRLASALEERLQDRDTAIVDAIADDNDRGGLLPLTQIPGANPAERINNYLAMDDDDPVKLACRASVPSWDATERQSSLDLLTRAGRGQLRWFADAGAGGSAVADLADQLTGDGESSPTISELTLDLRDGTTGEPIGGEAVVLFERLDQPAEAPRLALLSGVSAQSILSVPDGRYTVVAMAEGWARAVAPSVTVSGATLVHLDLTHLTAGALLFDGITAPAMSGAGSRVQLEASAASALGDPLTFAWTIDGPDPQTVSPSGARCSFYPEAAGEYTAHVTVQDASGHTVVDSTTIEVKPFAVEVFRVDFLNEQVDDFRFNPGERDTLRLWVANRGDVELRGQASISGRDGIEVHAEPEDWTLDGGRQTRWTVPVWIPGDYDAETAYLDFAFTVDGETLVQTLEFAVDFYVELDYVRSPVTGRVLSVSGVVANPSLETASLVVDRDRDEIYPLPLNNGSFEQVIILSGSTETRRVRLSVSAEAGNRREEASTGFMAAITPADFRMTLFWDTDGTDVDLWVTDPMDEKCYYANKTTASGLELDVDDVTGYGPENITAQSDLPPGEYIVQVHYYSDHGTGLPSHATVLVTLHEGTDQQTVESYEQTITDGQIWDVCTVDWNGAAVTAVRPGRDVRSAAPASLPIK
ncbi:PKD domain-containing protein [bacterium]|nr:PKD domain-containing protein [bacterium]